MRKQVFKKCTQQVEKNFIFFSSIILTLIIAFAAFAFWKNKSDSQLRCQKYECLFK